MKKYLITMGGREKGKNRHNISYGIHRNYDAEANRLFASAEPFDFQCIKYDNEFLEKVSRHDPIQKVLAEPSFGWVFKPLCIWEAFKKIEEDDILMWVDSNHVFIRNPDPIVEIALSDSIFCHDHHGVIYPNAHWTNRDMFVGMDCDNDLYWNAPQMQVNILAFKKNSFTRGFLQEWLKYASNYDIMIANKMKNLPGYIEHRHEQSVFSILIRKYDIAYHPYPLDIVTEMKGIDVK